MNETEVERIAAAISVLRPDWPAASLRTLLSRKELVHRPRRDVAVALAWVACESSTKTPARVLEAGPWWQAAAADGVTTGRQHAARVYGRNEGDPRHVCGICGLDQADCTRRAATNGHGFIPRTECLPPTEPGSLGQRGPCLAGPPDAPCNLRSGHDGPHNCPTPDLRALMPRPDAPATEGETA